MLVRLHLKLAFFILPSSCRVPRDSFNTHVVSSAVAQHSCKRTNSTLRTRLDQVHHKTNSSRNLFVCIHPAGRAHLIFAYFGSSAQPANKRSKPALCNIHMAPSRLSDTLMQREPCDPLLSTILPHRSRNMESTLPSTCRYLMSIPSTNGAISSSLVVQLPPGVDINARPCPTFFM